MTVCANKGYSAQERGIQVVSFEDAVEYLESIESDDAKMTLEGISVGRMVDLDGRVSVVVVNYMNSECSVIIAL